MRAGRAVVGHRRVAVLALDRVRGSDDAVDEVGVPAAVEQQDRLVPRLDRRAEQVLEPLRQQVHAAAEAVLDLHVDELDVRHREAADAAGEREKMVGSGSRSRSSDADDVPSLSSSPEARTSDPTPVAYVSSDGVALPSSTGTSSSCPRLIATSRPW